jgi:hypothetical protein
MVLADQQPEIRRAYDFKESKEAELPLSLFANQPSTFGGGELKHAIRRELRNIERLKAYRNSWIESANQRAWC